ncbi:MAG TPA: transposase [Thermoanaerobaculia bacterium]|jgi:REP element-mobilizing transposase RayT
MRKLRYVPQSRTLVSITNRTIQGRYLLAPGTSFNDLFLGILGRTQRIHDMEIAAVTVLSNHFHLVLIVDDAKEVADFMRDLQSKTAREVNRLTGWKGPVFERRYEMTVVTNEEAAQVERLKYVLANGVKENLVERVCEWPGVHSAEALMNGTPLQGHWFDRTRQYAARNQGEELRQDQYVFAESVVLSPIPCWAHLSDDRYRERIESLVDQIDTEAARARRQSGASVLGAKAILAQDPLTRPDSVARSPAPLVHAATKAARKMFYGIYAEFVSAFRAAAEALRHGRRDVSFPAGSFPPALPFVPS